MRTRELTEIVGRRDAQAIGLALEENWNDWGRFERSEATATTNAERFNRIETILRELVYGESDLVFA